MTTFIIAIPMVLYLAYVDYSNNKLEHWPVWLSMSLFILYAAPIQTQILSIVGIDISARELESFFVIMGIVFIIVISMIIITRSRAASSSRIWALTLMVLISGAVGYSNQALIPVRASGNRQLTKTIRRIGNV